MRASIPPVLSLGLALLAPVPAGAQGVVVEHRKVDCIIAGKHPRMNACFQPASKAGKRKIYFRPEGVESWFYVEMKSNAPCHEGVLPKPRKELVDKHVFYYVALEGAESGQTEEYDPVVVRSAEDCERKVAAPTSPTGPVAVFPSMPPGFVGGAGLSALSIGAIAVGTAGAGTAFVLTRDDNPPAATPTTTPPAPPATPPATVPTPTTPPPSSVSPLLLACTAEPRSGDAPLRVSFRPFPTGGTGVYDYFWRFGDGDTSTQVTPGHTYLTAGNYLASVQVASGTAVARCERTITVTNPPPPPPPPPAPGGPFTLTVVLAGSGTGAVTSVPPGITCGADCTEPYASGTVVTLTAAPSGTSQFGGWSGGGCSGTGSCVVTMTAAQTVTATFNPASCNATLNVTKSGAGGGFVNSTPGGISCLGVGSCTAVYPCGTPVRLDATAFGGSFFVGWTGGGCSGTGPCNLGMAANTTVDARFDVGLTLTFISEGIGPFTGTVVSTPAGINCPSAPTPGNTCVATYPPATVVRLDATPGPGAFTGWFFDCAGSTGNQCTVVMDQNRSAKAAFNTLNVQPAAPRGAASLRWATILEARGARGQVFLNGAAAAAVRGGRVDLRTDARRGNNDVVAVLTAADAGGTWRFELVDGQEFEPGSLTPLQGEVVLATPQALVFRVHGRAGERVSFGFRVRD